MLSTKIITPATLEIVSGADTSCGTPMNITNGTYRITNNTAIHLLIIFDIFNSKIKPVHINMFGLKVNNNLRGNDTK